MAKPISRRIATSDEWKALANLLQEKAPWKKGLPFLQGVTTEDRAAFQGVCQGYQMALDIMDSFTSPTPPAKLPEPTYQS